jgi:hypothetical protein
MNTSVEVMEEELTPEQIELAEYAEELAWMEERLQLGTLSKYMMDALFESRRLLSIGRSRLEEVDPIIITEWDGDFSAQMDEFGCVHYKPLYDLAEAWKEGDRFEQFGATFVNQNAYMLMIAGRADQDDPAWQERYRLATQASNTVGRLGPFGFNHGKVFASYTKPPRRWARGFGATIEDHYIPWVPHHYGETGKETAARALQIWTQHQSSRAARVKFYSVARAAVLEMQRGARPKWSGYIDEQPGEDHTPRGNPHASFSTPSRLGA